MRLPMVCLAGLSVFVFWITAQNRAGADPPAASEADIDRRYDLDPSTPLLSRVKPAPASVLKVFADSGMPAPAPHTLTAAETRVLAEAFATLPPLHRRILRARLRSINFLDAMPNTALTSTVNPDDAYKLFDITIRAPILKQNASEWMTEKERTCFDTTGSKLRVSIDAGSRAAIQYVLLHEATHVVDDSLGLTPREAPGSRPGTALLPTAFTDGVWVTSSSTEIPYNYENLSTVRFRHGGKVQPIDKAPAIYASLQKTPFVSLYGSAAWTEDLAEYVAVYDWTAVLGQPYRIVLRRDGKEIFSYEPMKSALVRGRIGQMRQFYAPGI